MSVSITEFLEFISAAEALAQTPVELPMISTFREFIQRSERILARPTPLPPNEQFENFILEARPLFVKEIKRSLDPLAQRARLAKSWMVQHDLLDVAGYSRLENPYTELMRWALDPATHPASALQRQQAWIRAVGLDDRICGTAACIPETQVFTDDGIIDIVLHYDHTLVVVEAKTGSVEHAAPSGIFQTTAYRTAARSLGLAPGDNVEVIFITPDGRDAVDPQAKPTTYVEFVFALAHVLEDFPQDETYAAYKMLFTHFLNHATVRPLGEVIDVIVKWSQQTDWTEDGKIIERRNELVEAIELLLPEQTK